MDKDSTRKRKKETGGEGQPTQDKANLEMTPKKAKRPKSATDSQQETDTSAEGPNTEITPPKASTSKASGSGTIS